MLRLLLHHPPGRRDLVGAVDCDVELVDSVGPENGSTSSPRARAARSVAGDVATQRSRKPAPGECRKQERHGRARPEADAHAILDQESCGLRRQLLLASARHRRRPLRIGVEQLADPVDRDVRRRMCCGDRGVVGELALARKHGGHALAPELLCRGEDAQLVVDEDVPLGRVPALEIVELELLVDVDEHVTLDRLANARTVNLPRLVDRVPVRDDDGRRRAAKVREHLDCIRVQAVGERVVEEVAGEVEQPRLGALPFPPLLRRTEVIAIAELDEAALLDRPVALACSAPYVEPKMLLEVVADPVVVEQRVVDVDEERNRVTGAHPDILSHQAS